MGQLPYPPTEYGKIVTEREDVFSVYLGNITREQYDQYVSSCFLQGFDDYYEKSSNKFVAGKEVFFGVDCRVTVKYKEESIMYIKTVKI